MYFCRQIIQVSKESAIGQTGFTVANREGFSRETRCQKRPHRLAPLCCRFISTLRFFQLACLAHKLLKLHCSKAKSLIIHFRFNDKQIKKGALSYGNEVELKKFVYLLI